MLGLDMLDVAIGVVFVYLLLSLIASAAAEAWEAIRKKRAVYLENGIKELLRDSNLVAKLYQHPLINGLYKGNYGEKKTELPSYIPTRTFALAIMDLLLPSSRGATPPATPVNATQATMDARPKVDASNMTMQATEKVAAAQGDSSDPYIDQARHAVETLVNAAGQDAEQARKNIEDWFNASMDRVSGWYKRRTQTILFIVGLAISIALNVDSIRVITALSTDKPKRDAIVNIATAYSKENPAPKTDTAAAKTDTAAPKTDTAAPKTDTAAPKTGGAAPKTDTAAPKTGGAAPKTDTAAPKTDTAAPKTDTAASKTDTAATAASKTDTATQKTDTTAQKTDTTTTEPSVEHAKAQTKAAIDELSKLGLPVGWKYYGCALCEKDSSQKDSTQKDCVLPESSSQKGDGRWGEIWRWICRIWHKLGYPHWVRCWLLVFVGWLITALAISLGAPFWFDTLNKLIVVRSTVKPQEKSGTESSKDPQKK